MLKQVALGPRGRFPERAPRRLTAPSEATVLKVTRDLFAVRSTMVGSDLPEDQRQHPLPLVAGRLGQSSTTAVMRCRRIASEAVAWGNLGCVALD